MPLFDFRGRSNHIALAIATGALVTGCLTEGTSDPATSTTDSGTRLTGSVGDGPLVGASMRALASDGTLLAEFQSDGSAAYEVVVQANADMHPLFIDASGGTDLVTNLAPDFVLRGATVSAGAELTVNVNPFTTLALEIATDLVGGPTAANIRSAEDIVTTSMSSGLTSVKAAGPMRTPVTAANVAEIVKASESLSEIVRRTRDWLNAFGFGTTGDAVLQALGSDLVDGVVDGIGGPRANARVAAVATAVAAQVLLEAMSNELHVNGVDATTAMMSAIDQVSPGAADPALADLTPTESMLAQVRVALAAVSAATGDPRLTTLRQSVDGLRGGLEASLVRGLLPSDYRQTLEDVLALIAGGSQATVDTVNETVRSGGIAPDANRPPTISGTPPPAVVAGFEYRFTPGAADADGDLLSFSISNRPSWAQFDPVTGTLSGTPAGGNVGQYRNIVISTSDGQASASLPAFSIEVTAANRAPVISGNPATTIASGSSYSFVPSAFDPDGDPLVFTVAGLPAWATFDSATGAIGGTPGDSDVGMHPGIAITVSDGSASASLATFSIEVTATPPANRAPTISGSPATSITSGSRYSFTPTASDADGDALSFSISNSPPWAAFDQATGTLSGVPDGSAAGDYPNIVIAVSDGQATATLPAFAIRVTAANRAPVISGNPPSTVVAGTTYEFTPTSSDADGDTLAFTVEGLPAWAGFDPATGTVSGTPADADVGLYTGIVIAVSDGTESASLAAFSVEVTASGSATGSATLSWTPPTENEDGSPLTDLAGYRIYWGTSPGDLSNSITISNPGVTTYVVEGLAPGTYEFVATAFNSSGVESVFSNAVIKILP